jgi:hypothetical protein
VPFPNDWNGKRVIGSTTAFPLVMPKKHIIYDCDIYEPTAPVCIIESYRNYYAAKIKCKDCKGKGQITGISWIKWSIDCDCGLKWTGREYPFWLKI